MIYHVSEKFKSIQGEGVYAGTPMAFIRLVGCSVGKTICQHCDTDFDKPLPWRGGGSFTESELLEWVGQYRHICLTGGEPFDWDLDPILDLAGSWHTVHIETSGTKYLPPAMRRTNTWVCVSPKPGYKGEVVLQADEVKVIVPGLGNGLGWPTLDDALNWAQVGKIVFLQPRNGKFDVDGVNLKYVQDLIAEYPQFRLSVQLHKVLKVQ